MAKKYPKKFLDLLNSVVNKRPKTVIQHILKYGFITSHDLKDKYGYEHPPRAVRDVREHGIPIETYRIKDAFGKHIAAYRFGDPRKVKNLVAKSSGRTVLSKALKQALIDKYGSKCFIYSESLDENLLQVDHRIPYEIKGAQPEKNIDSFMLLSPSANRAKSWTCEHCSNWIKKDSAFCNMCFWAFPEKYTHIAGKEQKILSIVFTGDEIDDYNQLIKLSGLMKPEDIVKSLIKNFINE
jgi:hypothetical protein